MFSERLSILAISTGIFFFGVFAMLFPDELLERFATATASPEANHFVIYGGGLTLIFFSASLIVAHFGTQRSHSFAKPFAIICSLAIYWVYTLHLGDWWIDDAGITFAYSRNLAEGYGLTFFPGRSPEEGYSSSLWVLTLAFSHYVGFDIPSSAKFLGIVFSGLNLVLCLTILFRENPAEKQIFGTVLFTAIVSAPIVVWSTSGQEHALQGLILTSLIATVWRFERWYLPAALLLSLYVLARPEAPLIVIAVFFAALKMKQTGTWPIHFLRCLPVAALPFITFVALMVFRWFYFADLMPNPYYAKTSSSSVTSILNLFGGGLQYVLSGLAATSLVILIPFIFLKGQPQKIDFGRRTRMVNVAIAVLLAHLFFVVWAKGDWMGQFRFLMPVLPIFCLITVITLGDLVKAGLQQAMISGVLILIVMQSTVLGLIEFGEKPTTPMAIVSEIGTHFADLAERLRIENPTLAHHDAGGIVYDRKIEIVDLGGLVNRPIAEHMRDRDFLEDYLFDIRKPTFFFGGTNFAARSGFADGTRFSDDYVPVTFEGLPIMESYLHHIRLDLVSEGPGIEIERNGDAIRGIIIHQN